MSNLIYSNLRDVIKHTHDLGFIDYVKIEGDVVKAIAEDKSVVVRGKLKNSIPELEGHKVGLSKMAILKGLLEFPPFQEDDADVHIVEGGTASGELYPRNVVFASGHNHKSQYSFLSGINADARVKVPKLGNINFDVDFTPTRKNLKDMSYFSGVLGSLHKTFKVKMIGGSLEFVIGDENSMQSVIPVAEGLSGILATEMIFPLANVLSALRLAETSNCEIGFADKRGMKIHIDSGIGEYTYYFPTRKRSS